MIADAARARRAWANQSAESASAWELMAKIRHQLLIIFQLARHDFRSRSLGSMLGLVWTFIQPLVMTLVLWTVITLAFKTRAVHEVPFALWLLTGLAAWTYFSEALLQATDVFQEYAFLVKKVRFNITIMPLVKILAALAAHAIFLLIMIGILLLSRIRPSFYWLQLLYYMLALVLLLQGLSWLTSAFNVFAKDVAHVVNVVLQFGFWLTPVFWDLSLLPASCQKYAILLKLNPLAYIIDGYRRSLFYRAPFWADAGWTAYFWGATLLLLLLGAVVFRRLKPHFADVL